MHIFNMLVTAVQSFKLIAWKLCEELITQTWYHVLKPKLKIVLVEYAVILSKIIFSSSKSHMHIFNRLVTSVQSFNLISFIPSEELITQTCYSILKSYLKIVCPKCCNVVKIYFFLFKSSNSAQLQYACNISAKFQIDCFRTLVGVYYTNLLPYTETL